MAELVGSVSEIFTKLLHFLHQKSKQSNDENDIKNLKHNYCRFTYSITKWVEVTILYSELK